jgi:hypothetical protein
MRNGMMRLRGKREGVRLEGVKGYLAGICYWGYGFDEGIASSK